MPAISVIVPVYQAEALLPQCVESVLAQTFSDWELLLIDDGSRPLVQWADRNQPLSPAPVPGGDRGPVLEG